jgi:hypothetical protein
MFLKKKSTELSKRRYLIGTVGDGSETGKSEYKLGMSKTSNGYADGSGVAYGTAYGHGYYHSQYKWLVDRDEHRQG